MLYDFFLLESVSLYVTSVELSIIWYSTFRSGCSFLYIPFCVVKLGIKTNVPIFKSVAGMERELFWLFIFCVCNNFFLVFGRFYCVFLSLFKIHSVCVPEANFKICG